jgi:hypothetical protein
MSLVYRLTQSNQNQFLTKIMVRLPGKKKNGQVTYLEMPKLTQLLASLLIITTRAEKVFLETMRQKMQWKEEFLSLLQLARNSKGGNQSTMIKLLTQGK